jgi:HSP20 family protein
VIIDERSYGEYSRQLFLGDNLDPGGLSADLRDGVLRLTIPVSAASKPRQIPLGSSNESNESNESRPAEVSSSAS